MAKRNADRDLLFGILALQNGFIDQAALMAAFHVWTSDGAQSIAQILEVRGDLAGSQRSLLDALVEEHVRRHGGDPARSLGGLRGDAFHADLAAIADGALQASLAHVRPEAPEVRNPLGLPYSEPPGDKTTTFGQNSSSGTRFRVLRPLARGGLGAVFVALDTELNREVALKQIQDRHADHPESFGRFVREAEVTGGLEHPGVVPVYGLGYDSRGRPYYAMRFIKGDSLKEACDRFHRSDWDPGARTMELQKLLRRFLDVCNAVAYAHDRGVLHRDLKPSNIMVGPYGETLVVDWGLAKVIGAPESSPEPTLRPPSASSGSSETLPGSAIGTPAYMSPEQATGALEELGPASDVYSLGATLYYVLTGRAPFDGNDAGEVLRQVQRGALTPPRQVVPDVPRPLEAVCLKAMAMRPAERYPTPRALVDDLERWLAEEPVSAWPEPWRDRARRWMRRHRTLVASASALVFTGVVALAVATFLVSREKVRAENNFQIAERQRLRAEANYRLALRAVDEYFTKVSESKLLDVPTLEPLRKDLLQTAREFYETFVRQRGHDPELKLELGGAYLRLAEVTMNIESGAKAIELGERARTTFEDLARRHPNQTMALRELVQTGELLGRAGVSTNQFARAERDYARAQNVAERLIARSPRDNWSRRILGDIQSERAQALQALRRMPEAEASFLAGRRTLQSLVNEHPKDPRYQESLANLLINLGRFYYYDGRMAPAEEAYRQALAYFVPRTRGQSASWYKAVTGTAYVNLAKLLRDTGRRGPAEEAYGEARRLFEELVRAHPDVLFYAGVIGRIQEGTGKLLLESGEPEAALRRYAEAIATLEAVQARDPQYEPARRYLRDTHEGRAETLMRLGRDAEAVEAWNKAMTYEDGPRALTLKLGRALARARTGAALKAADEAWAVVGSEPQPGEILERLARIQVLALAAVAPENQAQSDLYARRAVEALTRAQKGGWFRDAVRHKALQSDPDFAALRERPEFREWAGTPK
jgi:serine/threonine-protein kinase